jgi:cysteine desulfurase / selenocysteine lyase
MSTNTTNTNNGSRNGASQPKPSHQQSSPGEGTQRLPFASIPLPDAALLEKLANEFFLVLPQDLDNGGSDFAHDVPAEPDAEEIPTTMFSEELLPFQETSLGESLPNRPGSPSSIQPGPLTEADLRAIAASLAGATALVPGAPAAPPAQPTVGMPADFYEGKASPFAAAPSFLPGNEMFSFPGVPGMPSSAATAPPSGIDLASAPASALNTPSVAASPTSTPHYLEGDKAGTPTAPQAVPPVSELFSFPRVPALPNVSGIQTIPNPPAPISSPSAAPPVVADGSAAPAPAMDVKAVAPPAPVAQASPAAVPSSSTHGSAPALNSPEKAVYPGVAALPSYSELFSFPGVPGVQSPPGAPVLPGSAPTALPTQVDASTVPGLTSPAVSKVAGPSAESVKLVAPAVSSSAPQSASAPVSPAPQFEFRPDLIPDLGTAKRPLDPRIIRRDFPILEERVHGRQLVWLDNAATTQKPNSVIDRLSYFYQHENSNIHRAAHDLAARATDAYESAREKARRFLNASTTREIIFVRGTTEGINLVAQSWGRRNVQKDDEIVITWLEHHANIVPWQQLCSEKGARLRVAPVNDRGEIILEEYEKLLGPRTKIVSFSQVSNALGTITPAHEMVEMAHRHGARVLVDGAQAVSHMRVDVQALDCDFYVFSGHKVFGPTGIGVVYGKLDVLENMPPWQGGGNMIVDVTFEKTVYQSAPARFEAGTGNIADAVGLGAALDYVEQVGMENIAAYEHELLNYGTAKLLNVPGLRLIGTAREKAGVMSFVLDEMRTEDVGVALNEEGIAVRSGHHCAQPILRRMGVESSVRPSLAFYNTCEELDHLVATLLRIQAGRGRRT